ncbi:AraC family transcriptional regulator N-terminal domain-containing protein [Klebsiella pneumoniae]|nr:AraC family transcriptional regulator N-terminal domain-containing protein [Klebsiella pneumoniae]MCU8607325.1 AraC family transcriptional regulator N-terminal domain-containing protein [Klebsiella pneumoniae]MDE8522869.1 AraC family transcriptional regulator N-terminal domain-containing protein [Klebsiella pneumoniae]HBX7675126.1 hypothetical protein [Klebsiella pneumoniae]
MIPDKSVEILLGELSRDIAQRTPGTGDFPTAVEGLELFRRNEPAPPVSCLVPPSIVLVADGAKIMWVGGEPYEYNAEKFLITSLDLPASSEILQASTSQPCVGVAYKLDQRVLMELIAQGSLPPVKKRDAGTSVGVEAPASFIPALLDAGADAFSLHPETICREAFRVINMLRQAGKEVGMVLNPATPVESIQHYLHLLDKVTVMTVDPGYAGQPFIPEMLAKITQLHQLKETGSLRFLLEVDGSCNRNTYRALLGAGAQILVMGSSGLFRADMPLELAWETMSRELSAALHSPELV